MATRKKIERALPPDWAERKGTTSAGTDGISTDERIIFLRDDLMQFMANQNRQMAQTVKASMAHASQIEINANRFAIEANKLIRERIDELSTQACLLRVAVERRWWKQAWVWVKRVTRTRPR